MTQRSLTIAVCCSVLINILLIGLIGGRMYLHYSAHHKDMSRILSELPEERAQWFTRQMEQARSMRHARFAEIKQARQAAIDVLEAEQFDAELFTQKLTVLYQLGEDIKYQQMQMMTQLAEQLTVAERRSLSRFLLKHPKLKKHHR